MKIIVLGYMASGKSFIGNLIAKEYKLPFIDLDNYIEKQENKTVSKIFEEHGEIYFRNKEHFYLKELLALKDDFVLSLGGGTPCYANNMEFIQRTQDAVSFYLKASIATLVGRLLQEKAQRPLVANLDDEDLHEFVAKHLFERNTYYSMATYTINVDTKEANAICEEIYSLFKTNKL